MGAKCVWPCFTGACTLEVITAAPSIQAASPKSVPFLSHVGFGVCDPYRGQGLGNDMMEKGPGRDTLDDKE